MSDNDKLLEELTRRISAQTWDPGLVAGVDEPGKYPPLALMEESQSKEEVEPERNLSQGRGEDDVEIGEETPVERDDYGEALQAARVAVRAYERAFALRKARRIALAKLPFPWVRPVLRFVLWGSGAAIVYLGVDRPVGGWSSSIWFMTLLVAFAILCGQGLGRALNALVRTPAPAARLAQLGGAVFYFVLLLVEQLVIFQGTFVNLPSWLALAVLGLAMAAAGTLPWFGGSRQEYVRGARLLEIARKRQKEAGRRARRAVEELNDIHARHLRKMPASLDFAKPGKRG